MSDGYKAHAAPGGSPSKCSTIGSAQTTGRDSFSSGSSRNPGSVKSVKCYKRGASGALVPAMRRSRSHPAKEEPAVPRIDIDHIVKMREMFQDLDLKYDYKVDSPCSSGESDVPSMDASAARVPIVRGPGSEHISELILDKALDKMIDQRKKAQERSLSSSSSASSFFGFRFLSAFGCNGCATHPGTALPVNLEDEPARVSSV